MFKKLLCVIVGKLVDFVEDREGVYCCKVGKLGNKYYVYNKAIDWDVHVRVTPFGFIKTHLYIPVISICSNINLYYSDIEKECLIWHELGHCKFNHFKERGRILEQELEADKYAAKKIGKESMLRTLKRLQKEDEERLNWRSYEELEIRIEAIKNM
jgi:hypothetical protein